MKTFLVTGGAGFIGSNFILAERRLGDTRIINLDLLTYAGNLINLQGLQGDPDYAFVQGDIGDRSLVQDLLEKYHPCAVGNYYGPFDAQKIFETLKPDDLQIKPLNIDWTFYCYKCEGMASLKTCPHSKEDRCLISGTELRRILSLGQMPPPEFSRPEVLDILTDYYKGLKK